MRTTLEKVRPTAHEHFQIVDYIEHLKQIECDTTSLEQFLEHGFDNREHIAEILEMAETGEPY